MLEQPSGCFYFEFFEIVQFIPRRVTRRSIGAHNIEQSRTKYQWGMGNKLNKIINELKSSFEIYDQHFQ